VQANPGTHYNYIKRALKLNNGTLAYHLNVLEHDEKIYSRSDGVFRRFYPADNSISSAEGDNGNGGSTKVNYTHVQLNATQDKIITVLQTEPGMTQKEIARKLGKSTQVVNYNIGEMTQIGIVKLKREGNKTRCFAERIYRVDDDIELS
jgi:predicted transcriptional regulator